MWHSRREPRHRDRMLLRRLRPAAFTQCKADEGAPNRVLQPGYRSAASRQRCEAEAGGENWAVVGREGGTWGGERSTARPAQLLQRRPSSALASGKANDDSTTVCRKAAPAPSSAQARMRMMLVTACCALGSSLSAANTARTRGAQRF